MGQPPAGAGHNFRRRFRLDQQINGGPGGVDRIVDPERIGQGECPLGLDLPANRRGLAHRQGLCDINQSERLPDIERLPGLVRTGEGVGNPALGPGEALRGEILLGQVTRHDSGAAREAPAPASRPRGDAGAHAGSGSSRRQSFRAQSGG